MNTQTTNPTALHGGAVWNRIVSELCQLQDLAEERGLSGHVINPVNDGLYARDTAFAAHVFSVASVVAPDGEMRERARRALSAAETYDFAKGLDEPRWNRFGWHANKGSLAATAMFMDAYWAAKANLQEETDAALASRMDDYLKSCLVENGLFAHDAVLGKKKEAGVLNTTAMALFLCEHVARDQRCAGHEASAMEQLCRQTAQKLVEGQRVDGVWPYIFPGRLQKVATSRFPFSLLVDKSRLLQSLVIRSGDRSIHFADTIHDWLVLHYLAKSCVYAGRCEAPVRQALQVAWENARRRLIRDPDGEGWAVDFSREPKPVAPRFCNFFETSSYFVLLATLPLLEKMNLAADTDSVAQGLMHHVERHLLEPEGVRPGIQPYEAPQQIVRNILPRVGESIAWKGHCMAEYVLWRAPRSGASV